MYSATLFLGFCCDDTVQQALATANSALVKMFVNSSEDYLQRQEYQGKQWLGKQLQEPVSFSEVDRMVIHIQSLSKKVLPSLQEKDYAIELLVIPIPK